jgi:hypothetical protein
MLGDQKNATLTWQGAFESVTSCNQGAQLERGKPVSVQGLNIRIVLRERSV